MLSKKIMIIVITVLLLTISAGVCAGIEAVTLRNENMTDTMMAAGEKLADNQSVTSGHTNEKFTINMLIVLTIVVFLIIMFLWEPIRLDLIAISIPVILIIMQKWTKVSVEEALSGFSSTATMTVLAMFILSAGIYRSGLVQILGQKIADIVGDNETKQIGMISGLSGLTAGIINNTPVVALFIPMVTELARKTKNSPSKLLMPLSYASMMGGMLTLLGTSTNILASSISEKLINHPFSMFEFTQVGILILITGLIYLITIGRHLIPERIEPGEELTEEYEMAAFLTEVVVKDNSFLTGKTVGETLSQTELDLNLVQIIRDGEKFVEPLENKYLRAGDHLIIRADQKTLLKLLKKEELEVLPKINITRQHLEEKQEKQRLIEVVIPHGSFVEKQSLAEVNFVERYNSTILAIRHGGELSHMRMEDIVLEAGDVILLMVGETTLERIRKNKNFIVSNQIVPEDFRRSKMFVALGILAGVITLAALNVLPIVIAALAGVLCMVITGVLKPGEIYDAVNWEVIFLLAGLIPLGIAMGKTGTTRFVAIKLLNLINYASPVIILGLFYLLTSILTNVISNNASVVLMIPIAVNAAYQLDVNAFPFVLVVTFAASCAFMSPVGYQTNLMVYGPGGYRFRDFFIVGGPLQLIYAILIPVLVAFFFPL